MSDEKYKYEDLSISIPKKLSERFTQVILEVIGLDEENWEIFWDDIITAMENRVKVLRSQ